MVLIGITCSAQQPLSYTKIIHKEGLSAQQLYEISKNWMARVYVDSKVVMRDDNPGKEITGKGKFEFLTSKLYSSIEGHIGYIIDLQFKDGRLKFTMSDFLHERSHKAQFDNDMGILLDSIPKDLKEIGIEGMNRKACYKYFHKHGVALCKIHFDDLSKMLEEFIDNRKDAKDDW